MAATDSAHRHHLRFCLELQRVAASSGADSCFSPYSVASALGLIGRAARGPAAEEIVHLLAGTDPSLENQAELLRRASTPVGQPGSDAPVLAVANTLWAWEGLPLNEVFLDELAGWPGGRIASAPFVSDPEAARLVINAHVAETTHGLISELLPAGTVGPDTVAALVNALYLRVAWTHPFREANTEPADFHAPGGTRSVPTMRQSEWLGYGFGDGWQVVALPGAGGIEAVVLLPDGDLVDQEPALDEVVLGRLLEGIGRRTVRLSLPKIELDVRSPLTTALRSLGVSTMFSVAADFSALTDDPRLAVSEVVHQSVLRLNENGLEGAAATSVTMRLTSMTVDEPLQVEVNRPFLLMVRHATTGVVYFFARVVQP